MYLGTACPSCGTDIPFGPYTFAEHARLFGRPVNEPATRAPRPEHVAAQEAYVAADRVRVQAYRDVARLEDELARAQMGSSEVTVLGGLRNQAPDPAKVARLTEKLAAAREASETADDRTAKALKTSNRIKA